MISVYIQADIQRLLLGFYNLQQVQMAWSLSDAPITLSY